MICFSVSISTRATSREARTSTRARERREPTSIDRSIDRSRELLGAATDGVKFHERRKLALISRTLAARARAHRARARLWYVPLSRMRVERFDVIHRRDHRPSLARG